jgi:hypothetical protein
VLTGLHLYQTAPPIVNRKMAKMAKGAGKKGKLGLNRAGLAPSIGVAPAGCRGATGVGRHGDR